MGEGLAYEVHSTSYFVLYGQYHGLTRARAHGVERHCPRKSFEDGSIYLVRWKSWYACRPAVMTNCVVVKGESNRHLVPDWDCYWWVIARKCPSILHLVSSISMSMSWSILAWGIQVRYHSLNTESGNRRVRKYVCWYHKFSMLSIPTYSGISRVGFKSGQSVEDRYPKHNSEAMSGGGITYAFRVATCSPAS